MENNGLDIGRIIASIINLGILYFILKKYFFEKITTFMNNRALSIQNKIDLAASNLEEANAMKSQYELKLKTSDSEGKGIV